MSKSGTRSTGLEKPCHHSLSLGGGEPQMVKLRGKSGGVFVFLRKVARRASFSHSPHAKQDYFYACGDGNVDQLSLAEEEEEEG